MQIKEILAVGMYKQAVTLYLQLLKSMVNHFVDDEHFCYFDDMYSPEYSLQWIYEDIMKCDIDDVSRILLEEGHTHEPRYSRRVQDSKPSVARKRGGGSLDPGPNKPKK